MASSLDDPQLSSAIGSLEQFTRCAHRHDGVILTVDDHESLRWQLGGRPERVEGLHVGDERGRIKQGFIADHASPPAGNGEVISRSTPGGEVRRCGHRGHRPDALIVCPHPKGERSAESETGQDGSLLICTQFIEDDGEILTPPGGGERSRRACHSTQGGNGHPPPGFLAEALRQRGKLGACGAAAVAAEWQAVAQEQQSS